MTPKINLLVGGVAILCFVALVFVPWDEEKIAPEILEEVELVCGKGTILIDHICQVDKIEEKQEYTITDDLEIPRIEKTVDEVVEPPIEKPSKKSEIWFSSFFDWLGELFK